MLHVRFLFSPHPASKNTTIETVRIMRDVLKKNGAPEDLFICIEKPSIPLANELMAQCDMTIATGGPAMVKAARAGYRYHEVPVSYRRRIGVSKVAGTVSGSLKAGWCIITTTLRYARWTPAALVRPAVVSQ